MAAKRLSAEDFGAARKWTNDTNAPVDIQSGITLAPGESVYLTDDGAYSLTPPGEAKAEAPAEVPTAPAAEESSSSRRRGRE